MTDGARVTLTRSVAADAEIVFEVVTDLDELSAWLPADIDVDRYGPDLLRLWTRHGTVERRVEVDWDLRRITWGEPGTSYSGTAQVLHIAAGRSAVVVHVEPLPTTHRTTVEVWLDRALDGLAAAVAAEHRPQWSGTVLT
ncbi:MAG: hypothetical protein HOV94_12545 [Saccharothrix sp.]|nr:hypothetical protein [Saccharothrix sp.]